MRAVFLVIGFGVIFYSITSVADVSWSEVGKNIKKATDAN